MRNEKRKLATIAEGSRQLDDEIAEHVAWLISKGETPEQIVAVAGISLEEQDRVAGDELYKRRLSYLTHLFARKKKVKAPKTLDEFEQFCLKQLWRMALKADTERVRVQACKVLGETCKTLRRDGNQNGTQNVNAADSAALLTSFGGK